MLSTGSSNHLKMHIFFRVLTPYEARSLVALLHTDDCDTLQRALVAVANSCAFSANQVLTTLSKLELLCIYLLVTYHTKKGYLIQALLYSSMRGGHTDLRKKYLFRTIWLPSSAGTRKKLSLLFFGKKVHFSVPKSSLYKTQL